MVGGASRCVRKNAFMIQCLYKSRDYHRHMSTKSELEKFTHWQDTPSHKKRVSELFDSIPEQHQAAVLQLMEIALECGRLQESDANNEDL